MLITLFQFISQQLSSHYCGQRVIMCTFSDSNSARQFFFSKMILYHNALAVDLLTNAQVQLQADATCSSRARSRSRF